MPVIAAAKMIVIQLDQSHLFQASHPLSPAEDSASLHYLYYLLIFSVSLPHYLYLYFPAPHFLKSLPSITLLDSFSHLIISAVSYLFIKPKAIFELHAMLYVMMAKLF